MILSQHMFINLRNASLSPAVYSAEIPDEVKIRDEQKNVLQTWHVRNEIDNSLLHDKKTGFDAFVFERDIDGKGGIR
ncbi:hypothetical protein BW899_04100 [Bacillus mycoides]|uniref:Uncharacterized protein n=2 Tax=Bacillus mycoides TaxID=1405 RepID=A0A1S9T2I1_BACMY|nr:MULTISPECIES: hypothetical protein [Bacillus cereus group]KXY40549.1 hypothetical protein AT257_00380 [Bacillus cereus]MBG9684395.1 hypothetical protein [Bacillus mycoides]MBJ8015382.1 hypothetical protein [Bacillus cereus group sp. N34]MCQ6535197.1 hypothetical protein [Bacillus mycoides]MED1041022.1 hypothetical protein [Bacillus mycoides]